MESLYRQAMTIAKAEQTPVNVQDPDLNFAMACNGYFERNYNYWDYVQRAQDPFKSEFEGQKVAFFGPNDHNATFFNAQIEPGSLAFEYIFSQPEVLSTVRRYRGIDEDQASRIAYLLGGIVRQTSKKLNWAPETIREAVAYTARMANLGEAKSGDALTSAIAMYVLSGGDLSEDRNFKGQLFHMAEAISADPITPPRTTYQLGISQIARLRAYQDRVERPLDDPRPFPATFLFNELSSFAAFPTVGAEFHFPEESEDHIPDLWKKLAILNMSQYQRGSYVQLSRNDRGVIEVRMNPSTYPVTIANWQHMRSVMPELSKAFFTITLGRLSHDFRWSSQDNPLLDKLRSIGMLTFAALFNSVPPQLATDEINFGEAYLGQTVRLDKDGLYKFTGNWGGKKFWHIGSGEYGQLGLYLGFGENLPELAYYLSMVLASPHLLDRNTPRALTSAKNLKSALELNKYRREGFFRHLGQLIEVNGTTREAKVAGQNIMTALAPDSTAQSYG